MFANLLESVRRLRFPLTVGYAALLTVWILAGQQLAVAAWNDPLGARFLGALDSLGPAAKVGIITFVAAMLGSVIWHVGFARLVKFIEVRASHPDWQELVDEARNAARTYGEYRVVTVKGRASPIDERHNVPSASWESHLVERVQERERKAAEMSFRVTLATALVPVVVALGIQGGGWWWLSFLALPLIWLDVTLLKHTTLRVVNRYKLEDLQEELRTREQWLAQLEDRAKAGDEDATVRLQALRDELGAIRARIAAINAHTNRRATRMFALLEGKPGE